MTQETWAIVEEWRPVIGFEGIYEVSDNGRVRRIGKAHQSGNGHGGGVKIGRVLRPQSWKGGYRVVFLWMHGRQFQRLVHILVAAAFIGPCPEGMEVNHKRGSEEGDDADNLEYMTHQQNCQHAYDAGLRKPVCGRPNSRRIPRIMIPCQCGCGTSLETPDSKGRRRYYLQCHQPGRPRK